jgi:hypothetical protein
MATDNTKTEKLLNQVLREVREVRKILEADEEEFDSLENYKHPERILASYNKAIKQYPPRKTS